MMSPRNLVTCRGLLLFIVLSSKVATTVACGRYIELLTSDDSGTISSPGSVPGFPAPYAHNALCIWLIQAPPNYAVSLNIPSMSGQADATTGDCLDYLEVRNGSSEQTLEYKECNRTTAVTIDSYSRWLWIKFKTDDTGALNTGFTATYNVFRDSGNSDDESPVDDCRYMRYKCPNKECISSAYICDGMQDCGCTHSGCDEVSCGGIHWSSNKKLAVGVTAGTAIFCVVFFGIGALDYFLKKYAARKYLREANMRKKIAMQRRAQAAVKNLFAGSNISLNSSWSKSRGDKSPTSIAPPSPSSLVPPSPTPVKAK